MNCSVRTCNGTALITRPLPLCGTCCLRVMTGYAAANLFGSERQSAEVQTVRKNEVPEQIQTIYRLLDQEGWNAVNLPRATEALGIPERTAARRLAEARKQYAAELARRAGHNSSDADIDAAQDLYENVRPQTA